MTYTVLSGTLNSTIPLLADRNDTMILTCAMRTADTKLMLPFGRTWLSLDNSLPTSVVSVTSTSVLPHINNNKQTFQNAQLNGSVKEPNKSHIYETEKITHKASDMAEYIELLHDAFSVSL